MIIMNLMRANKILVVSAGGLINLSYQSFTRVGKQFLEIIKVYEVSILARESCVYCADAAGESTWLILSNKSLLINVLLNIYK